MIRVKSTIDYPAYKDSIELKDIYLGQGPFRPFMYEVYDNYLQSWYDIIDFLNEETS